MLLDVKSVDKKFNGVYALKGLDFSLGEGEIHGLVGENGAGKSTFIKILGGVYKRDGGSILWKGKDLPEVIRPEESRKLGINIIFQDNVLIPAFTGMENICLGRPYPVKGGLIQWKEMEREAAAKAAELGIHLDLKRPVSMMTPAQKKCVEIVRAMMSDCKLLILDEPTASLSYKETNLLFSIVRNLKAKGTSVLYVTHRLEEIMELIQQKQYVDVQHLAAQLHVTPKTIRLDLERLEGMNLLQRVHGGAVISKQQPSSFPMEQSREKNQAEKARIAAKALTMLAPHDVIFMDDGSTSLALAKLLGGFPITVLTNDLQIVNELMYKPNVTLFVAGGCVKRDGNSCVIYGEDCIQFVKKYRVNKLFLGISTITPKDGLMIYYYGDRSTKRALMSTADRIICMIDSSKFGHTAFTAVAKVSEIDTIITDRGLPPQEAEQYRALGARVIYADD